MLKAMLIAGLGGFAGTCLRFLTGRLCALLFGAALPWATFAVNMSGSLLIGILFGLAERTSILSPQMSLFLITGFCGGFTPFSSLSNEMLVLLQQRQWLQFGLYAGATFILGILLVWLGRAIVKAA